MQLECRAFYDVTKINDIIQEIQMQGGDILSIFPCSIQFCLKGVKEDLLELMERTEFLRLLLCENLVLTLICLAYLHQSLFLAALDSLGDVT